MSKHPTSDRACEVLRLVVDRYIGDGQPVGSKTICEQGTLSLSSASIRSILADLEAGGFVESPHTSAGRVPTVKGYRFFVNHLLKTNLGTDLDFTDLAAQVDDTKNTHEMVGSASSIVASITELAGIVTVPKQDQQILRHLEFLPLSDHRVLVILVFNDHDVQNRVIHTDRAYDKSELTEAANYVLEHYAGKSLESIRRTIVSDMVSEQESVAAWMQEAMQMTQDALGQPKEEGYVLSGEANLIDKGDDLASMRALFEAFAQKRSILHLLDQCLCADGLQIFIGQESGIDMLDGFSVVTAPYTANNHVMGVLGVIGPTRMDYSRAITAVDITSKLISAALKEE